METGYLFQEGGCDEKGARGRGLRALVLTNMQGLGDFSVGGKEPTLGIDMESSAQHSARATLLPH